MILSIDESIQKLKIEILSQDWTLSPKKIEPLEAAFTCLKNRFKTRKNAHSILIMADSVLQFAKKRDSTPVPPEFIDFLKEAMAHIVNMYEDPKFDPQSDTEIFTRLYAKFNKLKEKIRQEAGNISAPAAPERETAPTRHSHISSDSQTRQPPPGPPPPRQSAAATRRGMETKALSPRTGSLVYPVAIGDALIGILDDDIAIIKPLKAKKRKNYIKNSQIPLKDQKRLFRSLSRQMKGSLGQMKDSRLKKLILPLMIPRGLGLPSIPDEEASSLIVLSHGQWHGVLIVRQIGEKPLHLRSFSKGKNGDIAGVALMDDEQTIPILNASQIVEREGFLTMLR